MKYILPSLFIGLFVVVVAFRPANSGDNNNADGFLAGISGSSLNKVQPGAAEIGSNVDLLTAPNEISKEHKNEEVLAASVEASSFVEYAKTLIGTPYLYGSTDPARGLDCSGFVNAVSDHFGIDVPRSSVEFTDFGTTIQSSDAVPGDLILFTGTNPDKRIVGHMGIVTSNNNGALAFIHSSSGKANGVTVSELDGYYETRFVKVIRIFGRA
jgi:cell wall-associated NlpC family hydrolase